MLGTWLQDNKTKKWSEGLKFVQFMINRAFHHGIKCSSYEAMFGCKAKIGLNNCILPKHIVEKLKTKDDLEKALNTAIGEEKNIESKEKENKWRKRRRTETNCDNVLNSWKLSILTKRTKSVHNLEIQANKMKFISERRFCEGKIGQSVKIKIPDVDRARSDLRSILGVIISGNKRNFTVMSIINMFTHLWLNFVPVDNGNYKLGTTKGKLQHYYSRNQFTIRKEEFVCIKDVPDIQLSLKEVARLS